ncbi:MAG: hypothetical protein K2N70_01865, partial [Helicobacter sp.]|nr:hypothetical protein [Helicobacter sp.]
ANALHLLPVCRFAPNAALTPNPLARLLKVCAPHGLCHAPQRNVYVMPFGSNIDVARCGWDAHMMSNGKFCHCERV